MKFLLALYYIYNLDENSYIKPFIEDEAQLSKLNDAVQIDKLITTPIIEENHFLNEKLIDDISGNDYKEVVNQSAREWILKDPTVKDKKVEGFSSVDAALQQVEKEKENSKKELKDITEMMAKGRKKSQRKK